MKTAPEQQGTIEVERRIAAPPEIVFSYFTDSQRWALEVRHDPTDPSLFPSASNR